MTQIPKRSLHTCIAPARILRRHAESEPANLAMHARSARPPRPRCPLLRDQFAMPAKERVWCHKRRDVAKGSSADLVSQHSQAPTLIVGQLNAAAAQLRLQGPILFAEEVNDSTLLSLEPTHEHHEQKWNGNTRQNLSESTSRSFRTQRASMRKGGRRDALPIHPTGRVASAHTWTRSDTAIFSSDRCSGPLATITGQGTWGRRAPSTCRDQPIDVLRDVPVTQSGGINQPADRRCDRKLVRFEAIRWENPNGGYFLSPVFGRHAAQPSRGARSSSK